MLSGVVLTAIGVYQPLVEFAGAGATVPISGFGYLYQRGYYEQAHKNYKYFKPPELFVFFRLHTYILFFNRGIRRIFRRKTLIK